MIPRIRQALASTLACLAFATAAVAAPSPGAPVHGDARRSLNSLGVCVLGIAGEPDTSGQPGLLFPPDDVYYVLLKPTACGPCSLAALTNLHVHLRFRDPCELPMQIGLVKPFGTTCPRPDPGQQLFTPFSFTIVGTPSSDFDAVIPLPADWKLTGDAFLTVDFVDTCSTVGQEPGLWLTSGCTRCQVYEDIGGIEDVCTPGGGLPYISVEVGECVLTPTLRRSWGSVRILYR